PPPPFYSLPLHDALPISFARERPAEELRRLAHARRRAGKCAPVPRLDDGLRARTDAEAEPTGRDLGEPRGREGERCGASRVDVEIGRAPSELQSLRHLVC